MMQRAYFTRAWVSPRAHSIADWLIFIYEIQPGYGLAPYLGFNSTVDNHDAVRLWVHQKMQVRPAAIQTLGDLRQSFAEMLP